MPLNNTRIKNAKPGRHSDGHGLYLLVKPKIKNGKPVLVNGQKQPGSKSWVLRVQHGIQHGGKRRDFGLGSFSLLTLEEAREKAREGRKLAKAGISPSLEWRQERVTIPTFEDAAKQYHKEVSKAWRNGKHGAQWLSTLEAYAFPLFGKRPVDQIDAPDIQAVLMPIWLTKSETARRVRQRIGVVLDYAHGKGWRDTEAPMRAVAQLMKGIKQPRGSNFAAMPYAEVPAFWRKLQDAEQSIGRRALRFLILTVARSGEVRFAKWSEIDWEGAEWRVPPERTKTGRQHIVPLVPEAVTLLQDLRGLIGEDPAAPIFPGNKGKPMSDATLAKAMRTTGGGAWTVHGLRSSARDWAAETGQPDAWAEAALAHGNPDKVVSAYKRTTFFNQRRDVLMPAWAAFVHGPSNLVSLAERRA